MSLLSSHCFIYNPHSGRGVSSAKVREFRKSKGAQYDWAETTAPRDATRFALQAALDGAETVVAVGGDGTVHEVINGLMAVPADVRPKLGVLPAGSGDDFAFAAGIPRDFDKGVEILFAGKNRFVDIGSLEDDHGRMEYWNNTIGIGFDARVTVRSRRYNMLKGVPMYLTATVMTLLRDHHQFDVELAFDGNRFAEPALMMTLANGPREGGGFYTTPKSEIDDGTFEMLFVKPLSRAQMLMLLPKVLKGTHMGSPAVFHHSFTSLSLTSKQPLVLHADGEILAVPGDNVHRLTVAMHRNALRVIA